MYHSQFFPTYMFYDKKLSELNPISQNYNKHKEEKKSYDEDDDFNSSYLYKSELLNAFHMETFDNDILNNKITELYNFLIEKKESIDSVKKLLECAKICSHKTLHHLDELSGFTILFCYELFHITHICLTELFQEDYIMNHHLLCLEDNIKMLN
jgi:hypothetical protein